MQSLSHRNIVLSFLSAPVKPDFCSFLLAPSNTERQTHRHCWALLVILSADVLCARFTVRYANQRDVGPLTATSFLSDRWIIESGARLHTRPLGLKTCIRCSGSSGQLVSALKTRGLDSADEEASDSGLQIEGRRRQGDWKEWQSRVDIGRKITREEGVGRRNKRARNSGIFNHT